MSQQEFYTSVISTDTDESTGRQSSVRKMRVGARQMYSEDNERVITMAGVRKIMIREKKKSRAGLTKDDMVTR
jgi:hypothetical protein